MMFSLVRSSPHWRSGVGQQGVQLHGGIGMTEEYAAVHYLKRLIVLDILFSASEHHQARYAFDMDARSMG